MNEDKPTLFARYDPLVKAPYVFCRSYDEERSRKISIRPVWIIGDLIIINEWLVSSLKKSNWQLNLGRMTVIQHYKQVLLSNTSQSLIIEQETVPVMQIDILPGSLSGYPPQIDFEKNDYAINYLYKESFRDTGLFNRCLECIISYLFSFSDTGYLYLRLPKAEPSIQELLLLTGFESVAQTNIFGKSLNVYRIRRIGIKFN